MIYAADAATGSIQQSAEKKMSGFRPLWKEKLLHCDTYWFTKIHIKQSKMLSKLV